MNEIFHDMAVVVMVYINDILIFTKTEEGHDKIVEEVLCRLHTDKHALAVCCKNQSKQAFMKNSATTHSQFKHVKHPPIGDTC